MQQSFLDEIMNEAIRQQDWQWSSIYGWQQTSIAGKMYILWTNYVMYNNEPMAQYSV
jgi:hypothetical protein